MKRILTALLTVTIICTAIVCLAQWERRTVEVANYYLDGAYASVIFDINSESSGSFTWEIAYVSNKRINETRESRCNWRNGDSSVSGRVLVGGGARIQNVRVLRVNEN